MKQQDWFSPCCELSTRKVQHHRGSPPEIYSSILFLNWISFRFVKYLLFYRLAVLDCLLEMPGRIWNRWELGLQRMAFKRFNVHESYNSLSFTQFKYLAHSLQPKKCSIKPCIAFNTSLWWEKKSSNRKIIFIFQSFKREQKVRPSWWGTMIRIDNIPVLISEIRSNLGSPVWAAAWLTVKECHRLHKPHG